MTETPGQLGRCCVIGSAGTGSPGVTTTALALARQVAGLMIEADADGGVVGFRFGGLLAPGAPSLASLLADLSQHPAVDISHHVQLLPSRVAVLVGPPSAEAASGVLDQLARSLDDVRLAAGSRHVVVDVGRLRPGSVAERLASAADVVLLVVTPTTESVGRLLSRLPALSWPALVIAVCGDGQYSFDNVRDAVLTRANELGIRVHVVELPDDARAVAELGQEAMKRGRRGRPLIDAMEQLCPVLDEAARSGASTAARASRDAR